MNTQPEALRLADALTKHLGGNTATQAAAELRRLHALNAELLETLKEVTADYADRFNLDSPSTNPGIKSCVKLARAAIAKAT